jgi:hypothetical protein
MDDRPAEEAGLGRGTMEAETVTHRKLLNIEPRTVLMAVYRGSSMPRVGGRKTVNWDGMWWKAVT